MVYILQNASSVLWDMARLRYEDFWASTGILALFLRWFAAMFMPASLYCQVLAPTLVYYVRAINVTFHILQGPRYRPSQLSISSLFSKHAPFDAAYFLSLLGVWRVNLALDVAYCVYAAITLAVLYHWYRDVLPEGVSLRGQMVARLLVMLADIYMYKTIGARRGGPVANRDNTRGPGGITAAGGRPAAGRAEAATKGGLSGGRLDKEGLEEKWMGGYHQGDGQEDGATGGTAGGSGGDGGGTAVSAGPSASPALVAASAPRPTGSLPSGSPAVAATAGAVSGQAMEPAAQPEAAGGDGAWARPPGGAACQPDGSSCSRRTAEEAARPLAQCGSEATPYVPQSFGMAMPDGAAPRGDPGAALAGTVAAAAAYGTRTTPLPAYRSPILRRTVWVKIPWAEPEDLAPDFRERLQAAMATQGQRLVGAYVRKGCVELVLVLEAGPDAEVTAGEGQGGRQDAGPRHDSQRPLPRWQLEGRELLEALGLLAAAGSAWEANHTSGPATGALHGGSARGLVLLEEELILSPGLPERSGGTAAAGSGTYGGATTDPPQPLFRLQRVQPRVLLLPSLPPRELVETAAAAVPAVHPTDSQAPAEDGAVPAAAVLHVQLQPWRDVRGLVEMAAPNSFASELQVLARAADAYLPVRVRAPGLASSRPQDGEACTQGGDEPKYGLVIELLRLAPAPGPLLLEISRKPPARQDPCGPEQPLHMPRAFVPLLATTDPEVAAELNAAAEAWPTEDVVQLDELLYDLGTLAAAAASDSSSGARGADDPCGVWSTLGPHVLAYAEAAGWAATAARIRTDMAARGAAGGRDALPADGEWHCHCHKAVALPPAPAPAAASKSGCEAGGSAATTDAEAPGKAGRADTAAAGQRCACCADYGSLQGAGSGRSSGAASAAPVPTPRAAWLRALLRGLRGLPRGAPPSRAAATAETAAYQGLVDAWNRTLAHIAYVVECLVLLAFVPRGARAGHQPLGPRRALRWWAAA